jgi:hypothetical protein
VITRLSHTAIWVLRIEATRRDNSGNWFSMAERSPANAVPTAS